MIEIGPSALQEIKRIQFQSQATLEQPTNIRISVKSGGCLGLFYELTLEAREHQSLASSDRSYEIEGIRLIADSQSWQQIENLKLDYSEDLIGGGFRFHNPLVQEVCGCGISFARRQ